MYLWLSTLIFNILKYLCVDIHRKHNIIYTSEVIELDFEIGKRIKEIRESKKLSQKDFGEEIGVSRDVISNIEYGRVEAKENMIKLILLKFNISEDWLRNGIGKMFNPYDGDSELEYLIGALAAQNDKFKIKFITFMLKQPDENWNMIEEMITEFNTYLNKK